MSNIQSASVFLASPAFSAPKPLLADRRAAASMSAVEDVAARVQRLQETLALRRAQLQRLHLQSRYNAALGVDEDGDSGISTAKLEVRVVGARGVGFGSGFLSGEWSCVESMVDCSRARGALD